MDEAVKYTLIALAAVICALVVKKNEPGFALLITICAVLVGAYALMGAITVIKDFAVQISDMSQTVEGAVVILFKVLGISIITRIGAQLCKDAGEGSLGVKLELLGSALAVITALPLLSGVFSIAMSFVKS